MKPKKAKQLGAYDPGEKWQVDSATTFDYVSFLVFLQGQAKGKKDRTQSR
jgi:hypothetical protein